jgi:hypothetical protein
MGKGSSRIGDRVRQPIKNCSGLRAGEFEDSLLEPVEYNEAKILLLRIVPQFEQDVVSVPAPLGRYRLRARSAHFSHGPEDRVWLPCVTRAVRFR